MEPTPQAVFAYAKEQYGAVPEYLWAKTPDSAVLRHPGSGKWFAVLLQVDPSRFGLPGEAALDVLNVKCDPLLAGSLRGKAGYFPAYHMNKQHWISIALPLVADLSEVLPLLQLSYHLAGLRPPAKGGR